ncbi:MAG: TonB-dependent receptor, partial [Burkholderiaceae bacterium]|nr:TonB-dependent receptor [Burkholderiaceae bacterium]
MTPVAAVTATAVAAAATTCCRRVSCCAAGHFGAGLWLFFFLALATCPAVAEEVPVLETVLVKPEDEPAGSASRSERDMPQTAYRAGTESMRWFDAPGGSNPLTAIGGAPGIKVSGVDAWGLNNIQGGMKGVRIRGEGSSHGVTGTVQGLALGGPGPGPGYLFLFDKENIRAVRVAQGAVRSDTGGIFAAAGNIDTELIFPREAARRELSVALGEEGFRRYFARVDSGRLASGTSLFVSASHTEADKWRGSGQAPKGRENVEIGLTQQFGALGLRMIYARNAQAQHNYKALTYDEAMHLGSTRDHDYGVNTGTNDDFRHNRQDFTNTALIAEFSYDFDARTRLVFKPFYAREKGYYLYGGGQSDMALKWLIDHETYGATTELDTLFADTRVKFGYAWTDAEPPGPPTVRKAYRITAAGDGDLQFAQWNTLNKVTRRHVFSSAYLSAMRAFDRLSVQGGIRYAHERLPGIDAYSAAAVGDVPLDQAYQQATKNGARSVSARGFGHWLPQAGLAYDFSPALAVHASLGRSIGLPALGIFNQNLAGSVQTSQQYWDAIRPETATHLDLGGRLRLGDFTFDSTLYFSRSRNKGVSVYSDDSRTVWSQNIGKARGYGLLLASAWEPSAQWRVFGNFSWTRLFFTEDVRGAGGTYLGVRGNQLPDVPRFMGNIGLLFKHHGVT